MRKRLCHYRCRYAAIAIVAVSAPSFSCGVPTTEHWRSYGDPADERYAVERRSRLNIRVLAVGVDGSAEQEELSPQEFPLSVERECDVVAEFDAGLASSQRSCAGDTLATAMAGASVSCSEDLCWIQKAICVARTLSSLATATATADLRVKIDPPDPNEPIYTAAAYRVPPQTTEANASLAEKAFEYAAAAAGFAGENLRGMQGVPASDVRPPPCTPSDADMDYAHRGADGNLVPVAAQTRLADALLESLDAAREAASLAARFNTGAADAEFSRTRSLDRASKFSWAGAELSRARAGHILHGGAWESGLDGFNETGVCALPDLSDSGRAALTILRQSGIDPTAVSDTTVGNAALVEGSVADGNLRARLAEVYPDFELDGASLEEFYALFELNDVGMLEARAYIASEYRAFDRRTQDINGLPVLAPPLPLTEAIPSGGTEEEARYTTFPRFAATVNAAQPLPKSFYLALLQRSEGFGAVDHRSDKPSLPAAEPVPPGPTYAESSLAALTDYVATIAHASAVNPTLGDLHPCWFVTSSLNAESWTMSRVGLDGNRGRSTTRS